MRIQSGLKLEHLSKKGAKNGEIVKIESFNQHSFNQIIFEFEN